MRHNAIVTPPILTLAQGLKELYLGNNYIVSLGEFSAYPPGLATLDARDNKITEISDSIALLKGLQRLDLTNNDLSGLPPNLGTIQGLKAIVLDGNPLKTIRRDIISAGTVAIIKHLRSRIENPAEVRAEAEAEQRAEVQSVARAAQYANNITYTGKKASSIPQEIWDAAHGAAITAVDLSKNVLTAVPDQLVDYHLTVTSLNFGFNKISSIPVYIGACINLTMLDLRNNSLTTLPDLSRLSKLQDIVLSMNAFAALPSSLYGLPKLTSILCSDNRVTSIDVAGISQLPLLNVLDLSNNNIDSVPPELGRVATLKSLKLEGNAFKNPRPAILAQGTPALLDYLRSRIAP